MPWYDKTVEHLESDRVYSRNSLISLLRTYNPDVKDSSYNWAITGMLKNNILIKRGYDEYSLFEGDIKTNYSPIYSELTNMIMANIKNKYPLIKFTIFETVLLNEFLNHLIAQNTIYIQVEKDVSIFVFRYLRDEGYENVLYHPSKQDLSLYWNRNMIVVTNLISEAPITATDSHSICLEKMLVDIIADKCISASYSIAEYKDILSQSLSRYKLDVKKMLRYARRRNKEEYIKNLITNEGAYNC